MTQQSDDRPDDEFWRRPGVPQGDPGRGPESAGPAGHPDVPPGFWGSAVPPAGPDYPGPPPSTPPPAGWRPPVHLEVPPPRALPPQDLSALDLAEGSARTITRGVGLLAGAILLVVICLLCSRLLF